MILAGRKSPPLLRWAPLIGAAAGAVAPWAILYARVKFGSADGWSFFPVLLIWSWAGPLIGLLLAWVGAAAFLALQDEGQTRKTAPAGDEDEAPTEGRDVAGITTPRMSAGEFCEWANRPENRDKRWELERGEPVEMPSPGVLHGVVCFLVARLLGNYIFQRGKGYACSNDSGLLVERDPDTVRGPDLMVFDETLPFDQITRKYADQIPRLVIEVFSPEDRWGKVQKRIAQYLRRGIPLVWLILPEERTVTVFQPGQIQYVAEEQDEITGEDALPGFRCRVAEMFALPGQP